MSESKRTEGKLIVGKSLRTHIFSEDSDTHICEIYGSNIKGNFTLEEKETMTLKIVKAVNNHNGLVSALEEAIIATRISCLVAGEEPDKDSNIIKWEKALKDATGESE